jgi:amino acid transporter
MSQFLSPLPLCPPPLQLLIVSFTLLLTFLSYRGLDLAGRVAIGVCLASLLPFLILVVMGFFQLDLSRTQSWSHDPSMLSRSDWLGMLNLLFWNLNAFDSAASFAGEVRNPGWTYPRAMLSAIALIVVSYVLPILVGTLATTIPYAEWKDGTFTEVGREVGGKWLAGWIVLSAAISTVGLFLAEMSSDAYQLMGMAELGLIPSVLGQKSRYGTPTVPILLSMVVVLGISLTSSFERIIVLVNFLYALAEIFEIAAFLLLRFEQPNLPRPYRIPVNNAGAVGIMFLPIVFIALVLLTATWQTWVVSLPLALVVFASYFGIEYLKKRGLCQFYVSPPTPVAMETLDGLGLERGREEAVGEGVGERTPLTGSPYEPV